MPCVQRMQSVHFTHLRRQAAPGGCSALCDAGGGRKARKASISSTPFVRREAKQRAVYGRPFQIARRWRRRRRAGCHHKGQGG